MIKIFTLNFLYVLNCFVFVCLYERTHFYVNSTGSKVRHNLFNKGYGEYEIYTVKVWYGWSTTMQKTYKWMSTRFLKLGITGVRPHNSFLQDAVLCIAGRLGAPLPLPARCQKYILSLTISWQSTMSIIIDTVSRGAKLPLDEKYWFTKKGLFKTKKIWKAEWKDLIG